MALTMAPRGWAATRNAQYGTTTYQVGDQLFVTDGGGATYLGRISKFTYTESGAAQNMETILGVDVIINVPISPAFSGATLVNN